MTSKRRVIGVCTAVIVLLGACKKDDEDPPVQPSTPEASDTTDLSIRFSTYAPGSFHANDTVRNAFVIENHGPGTVRAGDKLRTACRIGGTLFALDLIGQGPTELDVTSDLPPGGTYAYDPGYLLGGSLLDFFATDTVEIRLIVYGAGQAAADESFPADPQPGNNTASLFITEGGFHLP